MSSMRHEISMRRERLMPGKHGMYDPMLSLKDAEINSEAIPVHMHQGQTEKKI